MTSRWSRLSGKTVLVVEDEALVGLLIENILIDHGCAVNGPHLGFKAAMRAAWREPLDCAILDINLGGVMCYPIADVLSSRGIPFVLASGYGAEELPIARPKWFVCLKPFSARQLVDALAEAAAPIEASLDA